MQLREEQRRSTEPARDPDSAVRPRTYTDRKANGRVARFPRSPISSASSPSSRSATRFRDASRRLSALVDNDRCRHARWTRSPERSGWFNKSWHSSSRPHRLGRRRLQKHFGRLLRAGAIPVSVMRRARRRATARTPDLVIVDTRGDASSAMSSIERLRAASPGAGIFAIALAADPDLILQSMRAGRQRVLHLAAADESVPRRDSPDGGAARDGAAARGRRRRRWCSSAPRAAPARRPCR